MDNARPHVGVGLLERLNTWGATLKLKVAFITQPSNSPNTNLNDLCFFNSLASARLLKKVLSFESIIKV